MTIAQWNVRTLLDRETTNRPERRTALVAMELAKYNIDIAVLSETRFHASGSLKIWNIPSIGVASQMVRGEKLEYDLK